MSRTNTQINGYRQTTGELEFLAASQYNSQDEAVQTIVPPLLIGARCLATKTMPIHTFAQLCQCFTLPKQTRL